MDAQAILEQLLTQPPNTDVLSQPLSDTVAEVVVTRLKGEVDRNWHDDANNAVTLSNWIVQIGEQRRDLNQMALGVMARGDSLKFLGRLHEAWADLQRAGQLFREAGNEIGWARTCIGRLYISVDLNCVEQAFEESRLAREIFERHGELERILRLNLNEAVTHQRIGDQRQALALYQDSLSTARALAEAGKEYEGILYSNMGYSYSELGDVQRAYECFEHARQIFASASQKRGTIVADLNVAYIEQAQGRYQQALRRLLQIYDLTLGSLPSEHTEACLNIVECYLRLNRFEEAVELAQQVVDEIEGRGAEYEKALALRYLATGLAELAAYEAAQRALDEAESIFAALRAESRQSSIQVQRGYLALRLQDTETAGALADAAYLMFEQAGEQTHLAQAALLKGQINYRDRQWETAATAARLALAVARSSKQPGLHYSAHLLLGKIAEAEQHTSRAMRHYQAAHFTVERMQQGLTVALRTGFLEDKLDAIRSQLRLHLHQKNSRAAFETLERMKSQVMFSYFTRQDHLKWTTGSDVASGLLDELDRLRQEHQWFYQALHGEAKPDSPKPNQPREELIREITVREKRMRSITERLYLQKEAVVASFVLPSLDQIQAEIAPDSLLIAYYTDGDALWAFALDTEKLSVIELPGTASEVNRLISQLQFNIDCVLRVGADAPAAVGLTAICRKLTQQLHCILMAPLGHLTKDTQRLIIVPFGALHYIPFQILYSGSAYVIEQHELVVLPTAGLVTQRGPQRREGALVLAHSWDQQLRYALTEGERIYQKFGGTLYMEADATRLTLVAPPCQILHIAAHGEYRIDHPELSFIQLADGQLYTDDVWQHDLSYELVTLSACETGRANVAAGEELIGLGRGFLYAGAGALLASLWRVQDETSQTLMAHLYDQLREGASKAEALRSAQLDRLAAQRGQHPAFWGVFQLMGDPRPLSHTT